MFDLLLSHIRSQGLPLEKNFSNLSLTYSSFLLLIAIPFISKKYNQLDVISIWKKNIHKIFHSNSTQQTILSAYVSSQQTFLWLSCVQYCKKIHSNMVLNKHYCQHTSVVNRQYCGSHGYNTLKYFI